MNSFIPDKNWTENNWTRIVDANGKRYWNGQNTKFSTSEKTGPIIYSQRGYKENTNLGIGTLFQKAWDDEQKVIVI